MAGSLVGSCSTLRKLPRAQTREKARGENMEGEMMTAKERFRRELECHMATWELHQGNSESYAAAIDHLIEVALYADRSSASRMVKHFIDDWDNPTQQMADLLFQISERILRG